MTCKDCIHEDVCKDRLAKQGYTMYSDKNLIVEECGYFKNKADFAEVVRCKDCVHYDNGICGEILGMMDGYYSGTFEMKKPTDFCSYGVRREE